jgi:hypothetical protein
MASADLLLYWDPAGKRLFSRKAGLGSARGGGVMAWA